MELDTSSARDPTVQGQPFPKSRPTPGRSQPLHTSVCRQQSRCHMGPDSLASVQRLLGDRLGCWEPAAVVGTSAASMARATQGSEGGRLTAGWSPQDEGRGS